MKHHLIDALRPGEMHPNPLRQMLELITLPVARTHRVGSISSVIHRTRYLFFRLLAAEAE
jgi:hypothetical protein